MQILTFLVYLPVVVGIGIIALITYLRRGVRGAGQFAFLSALIAAWLLLQFIAQMDVVDLGFKLRLVQGASAISNGIVCAFILFVANYVGLKRSRQRYQFILFLPLFIFAVASFTPLMIRSVDASSTGIAIQNAGGLYFVQILFLAVYMICGVFLLAKDTFTKPLQLRAPNYLLVAAIAQAVVLSILSTSVFASNSAAQLLIPASLFVMVAIIAFAIIRHKLFDVRLIVVRSLAYILVLSTLVTLFTTAVFAYSTIFVAQGIPTRVTVFYTVVALILALVFQPLKRFFDKITNKFFYQDSYDTQVFLNTLNRALVSTIELEELLAQSTITIEQNIKAGFCKFLLLDNVNLPEAKIDRSDLFYEGTNAARLELNRLTNRVTLTDELGEGFELLKRTLRDHDVALIGRLSASGDSKAETFGYFFLGPKRSGNPYTSQDLDTLGIVADEVGIVVQNALLFERIKNFNATLQDKIEEATRKLRSTNEKLRKLDETKDDFISMASHQLRTPLTSVKGYVSMVLDGDAGKITALQRKLLTQSFISSQRMVYLISDLLNVSRLKTGKFVIEPVPTNLANVIDEEIEQLQETAKGRNLELTYHKPEHFPTLMLDETKIRQVIMNFIDNAVYYTPSGGHITINLVDLPKTIEFTVVDDGIGVAKHEQPHLFTKFFRAHNAKRARPDGTGLGLFMAKKVIVASGGATIFKSQEGRGSTFGFTFAKEKIAPPAGKPVAPAKPNPIHVNPANK